MHLWVELANDNWLFHWKTSWQKGLPMEHKIIAIYCLIDEMLKGLHVKNDVRAKITNAEILTMAYLAVSDFNGNYRKAYLYLNPTKLFSPIDYSRFIRRINELHTAVETVFGYLSELFVSIHPSQIYAIDSFPVELCQLQRESQCQLMRHMDLKGYNASKKRYFYGFKVHMIATTHKEPVSCYISFGKVSDVRVAYKLIPTLPPNSTGIGDKGYVSSKLETLAHQFNINFTPIYRNNQNKNDTDYWTKRKLRKSIETAFSMITAKFGKVIKATSINGFLTKLKLFIAAYSIDCFFKLPKAKQLLVFNYAN